MDYLLCAVKFIKGKFPVWPRLCCTKYNTIQALKHVETMLSLETQRKEIYSYIRWYWNVGSIDASFNANMIYEYSLSVNGYDSIIRKKLRYSKTTCKL